MSTVPPGRRGRADRWATSSALTAAALVCTVLAGVAALVALGLQIADRSTATVSPAVPVPVGTGTGPADPLPSADLPKPSPSISAVTTPGSVPSCLDDGFQVVDCREPHRLEKVDGPCSTGGMLEYMSGRAGTDVVLATVRPWSGACVIENPVEVAETAADVLAGGSDDAWRRCLDDQQGRLVPCSKDHTGEYLATGETRKASQAECEQAAEAYLGQPLAGVADLLTVRAVAEVDPDPNAPRCLITVRGSQPLTASVRNLGVSPVPIRR